MNASKIPEGPDISVQGWTEDIPDVRDSSDWKNVTFAPDGSLIRLSSYGLPSDAIVRRTPHMDLSEREPLELGQSFNVIIYADSKITRAGEATEDLTFELLSGMDILEVEVHLVASAHFRVQRPPSQTMSIWRNEERSSNAIFLLKVAENEPTSP